MASFFLSFLTWNKSLVVFVFHQQANCCWTGSTNSRPDQGMSLNSAGPIKFYLSSTWSALMWEGRLFKALKPLVQWEGTGFFSSSRTPLHFPEDPLHFPEGIIFCVCWLNVFPHPQQTFLTSWFCLRFCCCYLLQFWFLPLIIALAKKMNPIKTVLFLYCISRINGLEGRNLIVTSTDTGTFDKIQHPFQDKKKKKVLKKL